MWLIVALAGAAEAIVGRNVMDSDGVSYLDLAQAWTHGHIAQAINSYWSPLYSWLMGATFTIVPDRPSHEFAVVHALNLVILLASLLAFSFLLEGLLDIRRDARDVVASDSARWFERLMIVVAYAVFGWVSLSVISVSMVSPDLLVAGLGYVATGLIVRIYSQGPRTGLLVWLGVVLALSYLAKSAMLILAVPYLVAAAVAVVARRRRIWIAVAVWAALCTPWIVALSVNQGHPTIGDAGTLNFLWYVDHVPNPIWEGGGPTGQPVHPPQVLSSAAQAVSFDRHAVGSQPLWTDPGYWYQGAHVRVSAGRLASATRTNAAVYAKLALQPAAIALLAAFGLLAALGAVGRLGSGTRVLLAVALPALCTFLLYLPVTATTRYVGGAVATLAVVAVCLLRLPRRRRLRVPAMATLALTAAFVITQLTVLPSWPVQLATGATTIRLAADQTVGGTPSVNGLLSVADGLHALGVRAGSRVATLGDERSGAAVDFSFTNSVMSERSPWARLAGVQIVADITDTAGFWDMSTDARARLYQALRATGVRAIVAESFGWGSGFRGWHEIGTTPYYELSL